MPASPLEERSGTSINFGGTDVLEVGLPLDEVRQLVQEGLRRGALVELEGTDGERLVFNPTQVKLIQQSAPVKAGDSDA